MWEMTREIIRKIGKNNETQEKSCHECIVPFGHTLFYMSALSSIHMDECNAPFGDTQFLLSILNKPRHKCNTPFGDPNVCVNHMLINQPKDRWWMTKEVPICCQLPSTQEYPTMWLLKILTFTLVWKASTCCWLTITYGTELGRQSFSWS